MTLITKDMMFWGGRKQGKTLPAERRRPRAVELHVAGLMDRHTLALARDDGTRAAIRKSQMLSMADAMGRAAVEAGGVWYTERDITLPGAPDRTTLALHVVDKEDVWWFDRSTRVHDGRWYVRYARRAALWLMRKADAWAAYRAPWQ